MAIDENLLNPASTPSIDIEIKNTMQQITSVQCLKNRSKIRKINRPTYLFLTGSKTSR